MAEPFNFKRDWSTHDSEFVRDHLAECGCREPGHPQPRYVLLTDFELRRGVWACPHQ
jgi:hypothetical protein